MQTLLTVVAITLIAVQSSAANEGTIRGRVFDPDGQPMPNVQVTARQIKADGELENSRTTVSDDRGRFEMTAPVGQIWLVARPALTLRNRQPAPPQHHPPAYFPGVLDRLDAWPIDVKAGEIIEFDFHMPPVLVGSIKTVVSGPAGYSLDHVRVMRPEANQIRNVKVSEDGVGYADSLRAGRYIVAARGRSRDASLAAWAVAEMTSGEIAVELDLKPAARAYGRILSQRDALPSFSTTRVIAAWTDGAIDLDPLARDDADVIADGSFAIDGIFGTRVFRVVGLDDDWIVVAVRAGRSDVTAGIDLAPGSTTEIAIVVARK